MNIFNIYSSYYEKKKNEWKLHRFLVMLVPNISYEA